MRAKFLASLSVLAMTAGLAQAETVDLNFWSWSPPEKVLNQIAAKFEKANPDVHVVVHAFESKAYQDKMPLALSSGDDMDVVAVQTSTMLEKVKGNLEELPPLYKVATGKNIEDVLTENSLRQAKVLVSDGKDYIAPLGTLGSAAIYYNDALLKELGLKVPSNRAELAAFVKTVKEKRPDLLPLSFSGAGWFLDEITLTFAEQASPGWFNSVRYDKGGKWNGPEYTAAFDEMVSLYKDGIFAKDTLDLDYGRAAQLFQEGKAVAFMQGTWENGYLSKPFRDENGIKLTDVTGGGLPVLVAGGKPAIRGFIEVGLGVAKQSKHKELAAKFIDFMTNGDGMEPWAKSLFVVPASKSFKVDPAYFSTEGAKQGFESISKLLNNATSDRNNVSDFSEVVGSTLTAAIVKGMPTKQSVDYLQSEWESGRYSNAK